MHSTTNRILMRALILALAILAGIMYADATNIFGVQRLTVNNNLIVTNNLTWNGSSGGPPRGALIFWNTTTCPPGWAIESRYDGRFPRGSATALTLGGSTTHTHTSSHTHNSGTYGTSTDGHQHWVDITTDATVGGGHQAQGCGITDGCIDIFGCSNPYVDGGWTDDPTHTHTYGYWTGSTASSHSHGIGSGGLTASGSSSGSSTSFPSFYNLTLCRKW